MKRKHDLQLLTALLVLLAMVGVLARWAPSSSPAAESPPVRETEAAEQPRRPLGEIDVVRIRELHHITDVFGDEIWPGFDTRQIPVAINNDDREELLVGHPDPPKQYRPFGDFELHGRPVMIREGVSRYGPKGGGWAFDIGGESTAYVTTLAAGQDTEVYLSLLIHECFHCFQGKYRQGADGVHGEPPEDDPFYSAMIALESRVLKAALNEPDDAKMRKLAEMFVAVRNERRKNMPDHLVILEGEHEFREGTATYSEVRLYQLLADAEKFEPHGKGKDPQYHGFPNAKEDYNRMVARITPFEDQPVTFFHAMYQHGMAQCLILDRVREGWKLEMRQKGMTQFVLLQREFPLEENIQKQTLAEAKKRFSYDGLLAEQKRLMEQRLDVIRGHIDAPGRLYRIYHGRIPGLFKWQPAGPVYEVPESLEQELARKGRQQREDARTVGHRRLVFVGGIRRFEKEGLTFCSGDTPVIFAQEFIEWFDLDPAPDNSDMKVESEREQDGAHLAAKITTDGFTLEVDKIRIEWSRDVVKLYPMSK